jgi:colanic acid/amylovoran biosynthesis glycosyltransferase
MHDTFAIVRSLKSHRNVPSEGKRSGQIAESAPALMNATLAVFTTQLGASFINRHVEDLLPGRTVVVARFDGHPLGGFYEAQCPVLFLDRWALSLPVRLALRVGVPDVRLRDAAIKLFLLRHGVTAVLGEFLDQFVDFVPLLDRMGLPYVVQGHGVDLSAALREPGMAARYLRYKSARAVLTRSEFHRRRLINLGLSSEHVHVNRGGVDVPVRPPKRESASKRFLAIGRMAPKKGPIYLLEAFRLAAKQDLDITLDFIGDGPLFPAARQFVDASGLGTRVRLHGFGSEETKQRLLLECGVFVQHSITDPDTGDEEGFPASIQEAMAHGMAVISTRHAGIPEAVEEGITGWLVDEGDVEKMAIAILKAPPSASALGNAGHLRAASEHAWSGERSRLTHWLGEWVQGEQDTDVLRKTPRSTSNRTEQLEHRTKSAG